MSELVLGGKSRFSVLWHLAWPAIIEQLLGMAVSFADTAMVGAMGKSSTAAVSVVSSSLWLIGGVLAGFGVGYSVQVANAVGAGDDARARRVTRQGALAAAVTGLLALAVMEALAGVLPRWLGAEPEVYPLAVSYLRWYSLGLPFTAVLYIFSAILRCMGNTKTPLFLNSLANIANIVLNFFLIYPTRQWRGITFYGAGLGVAGAAIASALSLAIAGLLLLRAVFFNKAKPVSVGPEENYRPDWAIIRAALGLGVPYIGERLTVNLGQILMTKLVAHVGTVALAANHIATTAEGICYLPEDRRTQGLFMGHSMTWNVTAVTLPKQRGKNGLLSGKMEQETCEKYIEAVSIRPPLPNIHAQNLSGGNAQKVLFSRWMNADPKVLIVDEPTAGVDVGAKAEIHKILRSMASQGVAVILISSDLSEVFAVSDRILVMREGRIVDEVATEDATQEGILEKGLIG